MEITLKNYLKENYISDAIGYEVSDFIYHTTSLRNLDKIKRQGFKPQSGVAINNTTYEDRIYFATSLIAAYDISVNFSSYKDEYDYVIFKVDSQCLQSYQLDPLFVHGIFVDYSIDKKYIVNIINTDDLFNKFDEEDLDNLY